ncbi:MAG: hypothetical protein GX803_02035 [Lentisphaerae bacterium]|jgi:hypothetical protein|nr:hypothetical protein [Lentisphaerota bacterium]
MNTIPIHHDAPPPKRQAIAPDPRSPHTTLPLRTTWRGLLIFYVLALALNASSLHGNNENMPYGAVRSFRLTISSPIHRATHRWQLDRPREFLNATLGGILNRTDDEMDWQSPPGAVE